MDAKLSWDETKRQINLRKHGLDFALAGVVLDSRYRLDILVVRGAEPRTLSMSYAMGFLAVFDGGTHGARSVDPGHQFPSCQQRRKRGLPCLDRKQMR
jgi:hypothetical protein